MEVAILTSAQVLREQVFIRIAVGRGEAVFDAFACVWRERGPDTASCPKLIDLRQAETSPSVSEIHAIARRLRAVGQERRSGKIVVVAPGDLVFAMMRMLQLLVDNDCDLRVARTIDEAERWLAAEPRPAGR